jgi:hypothetical protein
VVPDVLHVVPVGNDSVFDGVLQRQDIALGLRIVAVLRCACVAFLMTEKIYYPMYESLLPNPTMTPAWRGRPTIEL